MSEDQESLTFMMMLQKDSLLSKTSTFLTHRKSNFYFPLNFPTDHVYTKRIVRSSQRNILASLNSLDKTENCASNFQNSCLASP